MPEWGPRLDASAYAENALVVAPRLLGCVVESQSPEGTVAIRLTEVEAYEGSAHDPGSHAFRGMTPRNAVMFGPAGGLYVYFTYGMHFCANLVCGPEGVASAVLLRAGEIVDGVELARARRTPADAAPRRTPVRDRDLARGPANLARSLGLTTATHSGLMTTATDAQVRVYAPRSPAASWSTGPRVGVAGPGGDATTYPWRFWLTGDPTVSAYRPAAPRGARARRAKHVSADTAPSGRLDAVPETPAPRAKG